MRFQSATLIAALITSRAAAVALPVPEDVVIGGSDAPGDEVADLIAAYEQVADAIPEAVNLPVALGSQSLPEDTSAVIAAAVEDASTGTLSKRGTCKSTPSQYTSGPDVSQKTSEEWKAIPFWNQTALAAATPDGYYQVRNWRSLAFIAKANSPKGYTTDLTSYDPSVCAAKCNAISGCMSFNIFFERTPTIDLDSKNCPTAPAAETVVKCGFWGLQLDVSEATNPGQFRGANFFTTKAGSNAYSATPDTPNCFQAPVSFGDASIKAPNGQGSTYMGIQTYPGVSYSPEACAESCDKITRDNAGVARSKGLSTYRSCNFFNSYIAYKNNADPMFTCTFYTTSFGKAAATNVYQYNSAGDKFTKGSSYGYTLGECELRAKEIKEA